jgi:hypothetical protein
LIGHVTKPSTEREDLKNLVANITKFHANKLKACNASIASSLRTNGVFGDAGNSGSAVDFLRGKGSVLLQHSRDLHIALLLIYP